jgi:hypothetical protein
MIQELSGQALRRFVHGKVTTELFPDIYPDIVDLAVN